MFIKDWKKELFTIPNMLSLFRLLLIPVYVTIYLNATQDREHFLAAAILGISCLTDLIDGQIARHFNMVTNIGKVLDPLADKLTQLSLTVCLSVKYPALRSVLLLFVIKEVFQVSVACMMLNRGKVLPGSLIAGKICTTVLFSGLILLVLLPRPEPRTVNTIAIVDVVFLSYAFISYALAFFGKKSKLQDLDQ